MFYMF